MRKFSLLCITTLACLSLAACGSNNHKSSNKASSSSKVIKHKKKNKKKQSSASSSSVATQPQQNTQPSSNGNQQQLTQGQINRQRSYDPSGAPIMPDSDHAPGANPDGTPDAWVQGQLDDYGQN